jgi:hypothetical protein
VSSRGLGFANKRNSSYTTRVFHLGCCCHVVEPMWTKTTCLQWIRRIFFFFCIPEFFHFGPFALKVFLLII